jgi:hypothetical protein
MQELYAKIVKAAMEKRRAFNEPDIFTPTLKEDRIPAFKDWMVQLNNKKVFQDIKPLLLRAQRGDMSVEQELKQLPDIKEPVGDGFFRQGKNPKPGVLTKEYFLLFPYEYLMGVNKKVPVRPKKMSPARQKLEQLFSQTPKEAVEIDPAATMYSQNLKKLIEFKAGFQAS